MSATNRPYWQGIADVFEHSGDMHMITDCAGVIEYVNPAFESVTGFLKAEVIGKTPVFIESGLRPEGSYAAILCSLASPGKTFKGVLAKRKRSGEIFFEETTVSPLRDELGNTAHFFSTGRDVTKNAREMDQLQQLANFDSLTGLPNRNLYMDRLRQVLSHTAREKQQAALIYLDMDGFKQVNDLHGHAAGDELLQAVGMQLKGCIRQEDTVARLCGDEFAMILANIHGTDGVLKVLNKIICSFKQHPMIVERGMAASCSIGVSIYPRDGCEVSELLKCADVAMYRAKACGGNRYSFYCEPDEGIARVSEGGSNALAPPIILHEKNDDFLARERSIPFAEHGSYASPSFSGAT